MEKTMNKRLVVLGNGLEWCEKSLADLNKRNNIQIINSDFPCDPSNPLSKIARIHFSKMLNQKKELPFKRIWFHKFAEYICSNQYEEIVIIIYDRNRLANNSEFLKYLRNYFPKSKLVYYFTNIVKISGARSNNFVEHLKQYYDVIYTYDPGDAVKYGFRYQPLIYSKNESIHLNKNRNHEVFYVGAAKDRLSLLLSTYEKLNKLGIRTNFSIVNVDENLQKYTTEIQYNKWTSYSNVLQLINKSTCILDIIQGESEGFTMKVCEAVYYDKLLITTNKKVQDAPFYDKRFIKVITSPNDISKDFFDINPLDVRYSKEGKAYFSADTFLKRLFQDINTSY